MDLKLYKDFLFYSVAWYGKPPTRPHNTFQAVLDAFVREPYIRYHAEHFGNVKKLFDYIGKLGYNVGIDMLNKKLVVYK